MIEEERINWVNGVWEDGEWVSWETIGQEIEDEGNWDSESLSKPNPSTLELWELLDELVETAKNYLEVTGRHLPIFGELGELYGEIKYGIKRHKPNTPGSDGKIGDDFVEIKTISPLKSNNSVSVKRAGNFNKLLIVKITDDFRFKSKMLDRKSLGKGVGKYVRAEWSEEIDPN
jgi:hypothetical protein